MQERDNNSDYRPGRVCDLPSGEYLCGECPLEHQGDGVSDIRRCNRMDHGEIECDWIMTIAFLLDNPNQDFDLNLPKK